MNTTEKEIIKIKGMIQAAIYFSQDLDNRINVSYYVNYRELFNDYSISIEHDYAFDNHKAIVLSDSKDFTYKVFNKNSLFEISNYLDNELSNVSFDEEYNSKDVELEFLAEQQFEANRGN